MKTEKRCDGRKYPYDSDELEAIKIYNNHMVPYSVEFDAFDKNSPQLSWYGISNDCGEVKFVLLTGAAYKLEWFESSPLHANLYVYDKVIAKMFIKIQDKVLKIDFVDDTFANAVQNDTKTNNAVIDAVDKNGNTALMLAIQNNSFDIATRLLKAGASYLIKNQANQSIFDIIAEKIKSGVDDDQIRNWLWTLHNTSDDQLLDMIANTVNLALLSRQEKH